jgi:hypothetical protein
MKSSRSIEVLFITGFGPIIQDHKLSRKLYIENLGLSFEEGEGGYLHTEKMDGVKHFALRPLSQAARSCFGTNAWPKDIPTPQAWLEFDVKDVKAATEELTRQGYRLLVSDRKEPWGQIVTRLLSPEGLLVGVVYTPAMRDKKKIAGERLVRRKLKLKSKM